MAERTPDSTTPIIRRRKNCRSLRRRDGLIKFAHNNTSQNGEDGIIARLFDDLLPPSEQRYCVDVGAWDGRHLSNTYSLLVGGDQQNNVGGGNTTEWNGVFIEADPQKSKALKELHDPMGNICICAEVSCRPNSDQSLTSILKRHAQHLPKDFDFLSIDVDGTVYWLLADVLGSSSMNGAVGSAKQNHMSYRPKVICIEFNPTMPDDLIYIQPRDDNIRHGSSLSALVELANSADYTLVETTLFNAFFVQNELYEQYILNEVPDTSIEALHEITMGTELYQLYDGTIKLWGCKKMLWHRLPMDESKMQMLPSEERLFPFAPTPERGASSNNCNGEDRTMQKQSNGQNEHAGKTRLVESEHIRELAIDMSPYCLSSEKSQNASLDSKRECWAKLNMVLKTDGFALVRGTGVSGKICNNALRAAKLFLHEADESVRRSCLTKDRARRGYAPTCTENFASLIGKLEPNDLVRKYRIGPESNRDLDENEKLHSLSSLYQPNAWPNDEVWGQENASFFRSAVEEYFERTCNAADCILEAICDGIIDENEGIAESIKVLSQSTKSQNESDSVDESKNHTSILTLLGYQPGSRHKRGSKGYMRPLVSAHTDVGVITMLHFDNGKCASLQRAADASNADPENNEWVDINLPIPEDDPIFVVNVGDCLS